MRIFCLTAVVFALACNKSSEPGTAPSASVVQQPSAPVAQPAAPAEKPSAQPTTATLEAPASGGGLTWHAPAPFVVRAPKSSMRVAEYGIDGDAAAELAVFYFGPDQGGSIEANMTRWIGQFAQPDGSETKAKRDELSVKGLPVALVEAKGTYSGGMAMPGSAAPASQPDAMLLGAIIKGPNGSVFFKLVGPRASVEKARSGFDALVQSVAPAS